MINWKLAVLALAGFCFFTSLGIWQLTRAHHKQILLKSFTERSKQTPFSAQDLNQPHDWRFYRATLSGHFDHQHTILLDNKTKDGKVGYEVYTPFKAEGLETFILIDRGFIPLGESRDKIPNIPTTKEKVTITGLLNQPPVYVALGEMLAAKTTSWPLRVEFIDLEELTDLTEAALFPYILTLAPDSPHAFDIEWKVVMTGPERHKGYAVQWFALALTLLILCVALNRKKIS